MNKLLGFGLILAIGLIGCERKTVLIDNGHSDDDIVSTQPINIVTPPVVVVPTVTVPSPQPTPHHHHHNED